jgi:hypothetical protein
MKSTQNFKKVIEIYLEETGKSNPLIKKSLEKPDKNIDDCIKYILQTVEKSGCSGFTDREVFGMALHYYDEDNLEIKDLPAHLNVVVNHHIELSEEEKAAAKQKAIDDLVLEEKKRLSTKKTSVKTEVPSQTNTLF